MRLTSIEARELFSFDRLEVRDLPARTLVVVGPNGAGKTNLIRLLEIGRAASERAANYSQEAYWTLARFGRGRRFGAVSGSSSGVSLGIALTEPWERELLASFVRAALASGILQGAPTNSDVGNLIVWIKAHVGTDELAPFAEGVLVADLVDEITGQWTLTYEFEAGGDRYWWVLDGRPSPGAIVRATDASTPGIPTYRVDRKLDLDEKRVPRRPFALLDLLPPPGEATELSVQSGPLPSTELLREFAACAGITIEQTQNRSFTFAQVVRVVLDRGLVLLGDLRQPPRVEYTVEEAGFDPVPTDGSRIPLRLFRLKNGDASDRARYANTQDLFTRLTGRHFHIALAEGSADRGSGSPSKLLISLVVDRDGRDLPIELAGGGIWEALLLSATLPDSAGRVAVLDEPARNLHPTLQRRLLTEMRRAPGQFLLTTHSPYLVSIEDDSDLASILRFDVPNGITRANRLATGGAPTASRLRKVLAESADARALLFARGVVLVEGGTELGALPEWFAKSPTADRVGTPDALNVVVFSVDGDQNYGTFVGFSRGLGIPWAIVCDGSVFRFGSGGRQVFEQVLAAAVDDPELRGTVDAAARGVSLPFTELREIGARHGVFTLATGWDSSTESFETYADTAAPGRLDEAAQLVGKSKVRQGRHVASMTDCPPEVDKLYASLLYRFGLQA